jgi:hypothetical protein
VKVIKMTRQKKDALYELTEEERTWLERISRSHSEPAIHVIRAKQILAVADGHSYTEAARFSGRQNGDAVSKLVSRFNQEGLKAIEPGHGGGAVVQYGVAEREYLGSPWSIRTISTDNGKNHFSFGRRCTRLEPQPNAI